MTETSRANYASPIDTVYGHYRKWAKAQKLPIPSKDMFVAEAAGNNQLVQHAGETLYFGNPENKPDPWYVVTEYLHDLSYGPGRAPVGHTPISSADEFLQLLHDLVDHDLPDNRSAHRLRGNLRWRDGPLKSHHPAITKFDTILS